MKTPQVNATAARIAAVVNAGCPVAPPTLCDLITDKVDDVTIELQKEVQKLKAQMAKMTTNNRGGDGGSNCHLSKQTKATNAHKQTTNARRIAAAGSKGTARGNVNSNTATSTRPVCSDCGSLSHALGQWVDEILQHIVQAQHTYFKNSFELKQELNQLNLPPNASIST